jgi:ribosomal protein L37AE/L43A
MAVRMQKPAEGCAVCGSQIQLRHDGEEWMCAPCYGIVTTGREWNQARDELAALGDSMKNAIRYFVGQGGTEVDAARLAGVDRMTVRRVLGKR